MSELPRACIIGAGSSGIAAAKAFHQRGIPFDCFEKGDCVGGNWVFGNTNGMSAAYRSLHINTSRERMEYSDFPMPKDYPDFPHHSHIAEYFRTYVEHFGFGDKITFNTTVEHAHRRLDGLWDIRLSSGETRVYDSLVVANGHHWDPRWPEPPFAGRFDGIEMHAHDYRDNKSLQDRRVLVVGMGNSAMDIAVEASLVGEAAFISARRGAHVLPKYLFGRPTDQIGGSPLVPFGLRRALFERLLKLAVGRVEHYGLPKPDHRFGEAHPTISSDILTRVAHGDITVKPNVKCLEGDLVRFEDNSLEYVDVIVYCTGYQVSFPFFDQNFISAPDNDMPLFRRIFKPNIDNVFFIGLCQPLGAIMPLAEAQSELVADYLQGQYALPPPRRMRAQMRRERTKMYRRYVKSKRHTMQVDFDDYLMALRLERRIGGLRAKRRSKVPIEPRATDTEPVAS
jgi:dimethylaniline monooxygenase (N-oxide forming)